MADKDKKLQEQDFMPYWKNEEKCYEDAILKGKDERGKEVTTHWPRDEPMAQIYYKEWLKKVKDESGNYYSKRDNNGNVIKSTGPKHIVRQIVRIRRRDGSEYLYSNGRVSGFDVFGEEVSEMCNNPEVWTRTGFAYKRAMDNKTMLPKQQLVGPSTREVVYELPFNAENAKILFDKRISDDKVSFCLKDERTNKVVEVAKEPNVPETLKLFEKDFDYLFNADYITAQQKAERRQLAREMAMEQGLITGSVPSAETVEQPSQPPKGTYS